MFLLQELDLKKCEIRFVSSVNGITAFLFSGLAPAVVHLEDPVVEQPVAPLDDLDYHQPSPPQLDNIMEEDMEDQDQDMDDIMDDDLSLTSGNNSR